MRFISEVAVDRAVERMSTLSPAAGSSQILSTATEVLHDIVQFEACANTAVDPDSLLPRAAAHIEVFPEWSCGPYWDAEYLHEDVLSIGEMAAASAPPQTLHQATGGDLSRSRRFEQIYQPLGIGHEVRAVLQVDGMTFGLLDLARDADRPDFNERELWAIGELVEPIARRLRRALVAPPQSPDELDEPAIIILGHTGDVLSLTPEAKALLDLVPEARPGRTTNSVYVNATVHALWARARFIAAGFEAPDASARIRLQDGRMVNMRATCTRTEDEQMGHTVLVIEQARRSQFGPLLLAAHELTDREAEVVSHLLRGDSAQQISTLLRISVHTVRTHTKRIHEKLGISSRGELARMFIDNEFLPKAAITGASDH